ncbi:hypothetical protein MRX96_024677 [Rhipicephalus microplus]
MQCPKNLSGCSEELIKCRNPKRHHVLFSAQLRGLGDCCWNVVVHPETPIAEMPRTSCVSVRANAKPTEGQLEIDTKIITVSSYPHYFGKVRLRMIVGCPASWTDEDVRKAREEHESFKEVLYSVLTTTSCHVTYR